MAQALLQVTPSYGLNNFEEHILVSKQLRKLEICFRIKGKGSGSAQNICVINFLENSTYYFDKYKSAFVFILDASVD